MWILSILSEKSDDDFITRIDPEYFAFGSHHEESRFPVTEDFDLGERYREDGKCSNLARLFVRDWKWMYIRTPNDTDTLSCA